MDDGTAVDNDGMAEVLVTTGGRDGMDDVVSVEIEALAVVLSALTQLTLLGHSQRCNASLK